MGTARGFPIKDVGNDRRGIENIGNGKGGIEDVGNGAEGEVGSPTWKKPMDSR